MTDPPHKRGIAPDPPRPVWMTKAEDVRLLQRVAAAAKAGTKIERMDADALIVLADRWFSAPDDSVTVAQAIIEHGINHRHHPRPMAWDVCIALGRKNA